MMKVFAVFICLVSLCYGVDDKWSYNEKDVITQGQKLDRSTYIKTVNSDKGVDKDLATILLGIDGNRVYTNYTYIVFRKNEVTYCIVDLNKSEMARDKYGQEIHVYCGSRRLYKLAGTVWESIGGMHYD